MNSFAAANQQKSQPSSASVFPMRIGVGAAVEYMTAEAAIKIKPTASLGNIAFNQSHIAKKLQLAPCLEMGATLYDDYYLGLHFSWRHSGAKNTSRSRLNGQYHFIHEFKVNSYFNSLFKPGYRLTPQIMVYGLIGPSIANWSYTTEQYFVHAITQVSTLRDQQTTKRKSIGLGLGMGFEYLFQKKYAFSFDYTYYAHRSKTESKNVNYDEQIPVIGGPNITRRRSGTIVKTIRPSYSTFAVRFTYFFSIP